MTTESNQNEENDEIEILHRVTIEEEEVEVSKLPSEIKDAMRKFNEKLKEYEKSGDSKIFFELQQDDVAIANNIVTFLEDEQSEEEEEDETYLEEKKEEKKEAVKTAPSAPKKAATPVAPVVEKTAPLVQEVVTPPIEPVAPPVVNTAPTVVATPAPVAPPAPKTEEEKVVAIMKDGIIGVKDLETILNREPEYPDEQVGSIKLRKQYLRPFYERVK